MMRLQRLPWGACLLALAIAALGWLLHEWAIGSGLVNVSYDLLHLSRTRQILPTEAVIVYLDEKSHKELRQPLNAAWDRAIHAELIDRLTAAGAKAIVMDIVFSDANREKADADRKLIEAVKRSRRVILGADHVTDLDGQRRFIPPFALLGDSAVEYGSVEMGPSRDLCVRIHAANEQVSSMSWAAAKFVGAPITTRMDGEAFQPATEFGVRRWIHYYGPPGWLPHTSYVDAFRPELVPDSFFKDKTVFIGSRIMTRFAGDRKDEYRNPYSFLIASQEEDPFIAGVEIQATMFLNILRGDWLTRLPWRLELAIMMVLGGAVGFGLMRLRPGIAIVAAFVCLLLVVIISRELFLRQLIWFPWMIPAVQIGVALLCAVAWNSVRLYVENRLFAQTLGLYLPPKLVKKFAADRERKFLKPGAEEQKLTILFSDIENFTALSEGMAPNELAKMMNEYFQSAVADCIHATDGTVVKYIGDAIFAFWNAPETQVDHAKRACEAALRFREQNNKLFHVRRLVTRIGLHTGVANVGNFGSETRVDYTAMGEGINLASRMEGLNKFLGTSVLITSDTKKEIGDDFVTRYLGRFQLKGFERSVDVYELLGRKGEVSLAAREEFDTALRLFQQRDLTAAENAFQRMLETAPDDGATKFYTRHIAEVRGQGIPESWSGDVELKEK